MIDMVEMQDGLDSDIDKKIRTVSAKISSADYEFIKQNRISPSKLFRAAIRELRMKQPKV